MRKIMAVMAAGSVALCAGCAADNQEAYEFAERCIGAGEYEVAAEYFADLGEYRDSADYLLYADALAALSEGNEALARANLEQIAPFKSSDRYLRCLDAIALEEAGDLDAALSVYRELGTFANCDVRVAALEEEIPARERAACRELMDDGAYGAALDRLKAMQPSSERDLLLAECENAITQQAYDDAAALAEAGSLLEAMAAFEALGNTLDAPARLASIRSSVYLEAIRTDVAPDTAPALVKAYSALGEYLDCPDRLSAIQARLACHEAMQAAGNAFIAMGAADGETVVWQGSMQADGSLRLTGNAPSDALSWTAAERSIIVNVSSQQPLRLNPASRPGPAQGTAAVQAVARTHQTVVTVDVSMLPFTGGTGTADDPFVLE